MDLSKLPKLSDTKSELPPPATSPQPMQPLPVQPMAYRPPGIGGEIWISLIVGLVLAYLGGSFARFAIARMTGHPFHTYINWTDGPNAGNEVGYFDLQGFTAWSDMGIFLFGLTLLFEAAAKTFLLFKPSSISKLVLMLAIVLTLFAVVLNVIACAKMMSVGITPLVSALAVAFGGWILFDEWSTLQHMKPRPLEN